MSKEQITPKHPSNRTGLDDLERVFTFQPATAQQREAYIEIREAARSFAETVLRCCPPCADTTTAVRKIREAVMTANAAVALDPRNV